MLPVYHIARHIHTHIHIYRPFRISSGWWEETGAPGGQPHRHKENIKFTPTKASHSYIVQIGRGEISVLPEYPSKEIDHCDSFYLEVMADCTFALWNLVVVTILFQSLSPEIKFLIRLRSKKGTVRTLLCRLIIWKESLMFSKYANLPMISRLRPAKTAKNSWLQRFFVLFGSCCSAVKFRGHSLQATFITYTFAIVQPQLACGLKKAPNVLPYIASRPQTEDKSSQQSD